MKTLIWSELNAAERVAALARPEAQMDAAVSEAVDAILVDVKVRGDEALREYTKRFDGVTLETLEVSQEELSAALDALPTDERTALETAKTNIAAFHEKQRPQSYMVETMPGVVCQRIPKPLQSVGLYVPGGTAPLVSTVLMLAVPAQMAGVGERVMVSPPGPDGRINSKVLAAAKLCGVSRVFTVGGAQAIGALAYGTETIPKCMKVFGPGNAYVAMAKASVSMRADGPASDLPAGPSEVMVVADGTARPDFVAADLLAQAEHDVMAQVVGVVDTLELAARIEAEIEVQLAGLSRHNIAKAALSNARMIVAEAGETLAIIDAYAPEHLILQTAEAQALTRDLSNAGSIFIGPWTPESVGDYASGTNHTLPTGGAAMAYSGVNLESFYKLVTVQELSREGLERLGPTVELMADMEGLDAHGKAVSVRLSS